MNLNYSATILLGGDEVDIQAGTFAFANYWVQRLIITILIGIVI